MKAFQFFSLILLSALVFTSCKTSYIVPIETQKPGALVIPTKVEGLLVVNNAVPQAGGQVVIPQAQKEATPNYKIEMDTTLWAAIFYTANGISEANFFDNVSTFQEALRDLNDNEWLAVKPITKEKCDSLYEESGCNVILSIDRLLFNMEYSVRNSSLQNDAFLQTKCRGVLSVSIYLKSRDRKLTSFSIQDSIQNFRLLGDTARVFRRIPTLIVRDLTRILSLQVASYLVPEWELTERTIYTSSNSQMRKADKYFNKKEWEKARIIWEKIFYEKEKNTDTNKARMAMNIGAAYEMNDNLVMASYWAQRAKNIYSSIAVELPKDEKLKADEYLAILNSRVQNNNILDSLHE